MARAHFRTPPPAGVRKEHITRETLLISKLIWGGGGGVFTPWLMNQGTVEASTRLVSDPYLLEQ